MTLPIALFVLFAAIAAAAAPLFVYTTTLALFGLAHVLVELRYVDARFGRRTSRELRLGAALLLTAIVVVRALHVRGAIGDAHAHIELALVTALGALALPALFRRGPRAFAIGLFVVVTLATGAAVAPALTLVILAIVHNATPIGFLVEASDNRARTLCWSTLVFMGVPLVVATGALRMLGVHAPDLALFPSGPLSSHLAVYVPAQLLAWDRAVDAFAAAVCAQVLHYGAILCLLPRRLSATDTPIFAWPSGHRFIFVILVLSAGLAAHFALDFHEARAWYGLAAAVHAWIEVPVLLLACTGALRR